MSVFQKLFLDVVLAYVNRIYLFIIPKGTGVLVSHMLMLEMLVEAIPVNNYIVPRLGKTNRLSLSLSLSPPFSLSLSLSSSLSLSVYVTVNLYNQVICILLTEI